ncbi:MAG: LPXTG cell wall anchor domain-containing protein [Solirubrobacteraceae bacterium]
MPVLSRIAPLAVAAALLLTPAGALAQSGAGDQQYSDPFSGTSAPSKPKASKPAQSTAPSTQQQQAAPTQTTQSTPAAPAAPAPAASAATSAQLPRTGADVLPLALLGLALIGAGVLLLRRRSAHGREG